MAFGSTWLALPFRTRGIIVSAMVIVGCSAQNRAVAVHDSPIAKIATVDAPAPVPPGSVAVAGTGTIDHRRSGYFENPDLQLTKYGGAGRIRVGVFEGLELQAEGAGYRWKVGSSLCDDGNPSQSFDSVLGTGRGGLKFSPSATRSFFAITAGFGGGRARTGSFMSPDVGLSFGYENDVFVPFGQVELLGSFPLARRRVTAVDCGRFDDTIYAELNPTNVLKGRGTFGFKIPFPEGFNGRTHVLGQLYVAGIVNVGGYASAGMVAGFELVIGKRSASVERRRKRPKPTPPPPAQPAGVPAPPPPAGTAAAPSGPEPQPSFGEVIPTNPEAPPAASEPPAQSPPPPTESAPPPTESAPPPSAAPPSRP